MLVAPFARMSVFTGVAALVLAVVASPTVQAKPVAKPADAPVYVKPGEVKGDAKKGANNNKLIAAGKRLYLEGRSVSGGFIKAIVQGDVSLNGDQATCQSCHGRSGMGTIESGTIPPGITGPILFTPDIRTSTQRARPPYTEKTLARAIRAGIDSSGRKLNPLMPHFQLSERDLAALTAYLRQLGAKLSPGSTDTSMRVATLIAGDVDPALSKPYIDVIQAFVSARNRGGPQRLRGGHFVNDIKETFREWSLDIWRVSGPAKTWPAQIEKLYRKKPVFALIGGLSAGPWQPVDEFCETKEIPCILPDVDLPPDQVKGFYSYYFSRGLLLEADIIASVLQSKKLDANIVSIMDSGNARSLAAATALEKLLKKNGVNVKTLDVHNQPDLSLASVANKPSAIVVWLDAKHVQLLAKEKENKGPPLFLSATLIGAMLDKLPATLKARSQVVQLTALANKPDPSLRRFLAWAHVRKVKLTQKRHQALAYFACMFFAEGVKHTGLYLSREHILDLLNHSSKLSAYIPLYTRGDITPWQRVLSRGGYLIDLSGQAKPAWIVP